MVMAACLTHSTLFIKTHFCASPSCPCRLLELSLQALQVDAALTVDSATSVLADAKRRYHRLAMQLHPDKCKLPGVDSAFSTLGRAMRIISNHGSAAEDGPTAERPEEATVDGEVGADALGHLHSGRGILDKVLWTQHRLVVQAHVIPPALHGKLLSRVDYSKAAACEGGDEPLLFVPLAHIPTFQRSTGGDTVGVQVRAVVNDMLQGLTEMAASAGGTQAGSHPSVTAGAPEPGITAEAPSCAPAQSAGFPQEEELVEGVLLVSCRAALQGRFPLNGTYFQINEAFVDCETAEVPLKVRQCFALF